MKHLHGVSRARGCVASERPRQAVSLLEKQAFTDMVERNLTQVVTVINMFAGLKTASQSGT